MKTTLLLSRWQLAEHCGFPCCGLSFPTITSSRGQNVVDTRGIARASKAYVTRWNFFVKLQREDVSRTGVTRRNASAKFSVAAVARVEHGSTFRETVVPRECETVLWIRRCYTVQLLVKPASRCSFTKKFHRVTNWRDCGKSPRHGKPLYFLPQYLEVKASKPELRDMLASATVIWTPYHGASTNQNARNCWIVVKDGYRSEGYSRRCWRPLWTINSSVFFIVFRTFLKPRILFWQYFCIGIIRHPCKR